MKTRHRRKGLLGLLLVAVMLCALMVPASPALAAGNDISFSDPYYSTPGDNPKGYVDIGETFYVDIMFDSDTATRGGEVDFDFDETLVQVNAVTEGTYYSSVSGVSTFYLPPTIDNGTGHVEDIVVVCTGGYPAGATGIGVYATIELEALANGLSPLELGPDSNFADIDANELNPTLNDGEVQVGEPAVLVNVDLEVDGLNGEIINVTDYGVPAGTVTEDGFTMNAQTVMGALVTYIYDSAESGIADPDAYITLTDPWGTGSAYVFHLGTTTDDDDSWSYALNESVPMVGAADQAIAEGDVIHWFNYGLGYYNLVLTPSVSYVECGDPITFTVVYTDGTGATDPAVGAEVFISTVMGTYGPETGTSYGYTNASGQLTIDPWDTGGTTFYPYAEYLTDTTQWAYPSVEFESNCPLTEPSDGTIFVHKNLLAEITITITTDDVNGDLSVGGNCMGEAEGAFFNVKTNGKYSVTATGENGGYMAEWNSTDGYVLPLRTLISPLYVYQTDDCQVAWEGTALGGSLTTPQILVTDDDCEGQEGGAGEDYPVLFRQQVDMGDDVLPAGSEYAMTVTFTAMYTGPCD